jgi:hypothetical protein
MSCIAIKSKNGGASLLFDSSLEPSAGLWATSDEEEASNDIKLRENCRIRGATSSATLLGIIPELLLPAGTISVHILVIIPFFLPPDIPPSISYCPCSAGRGPAEERPI